MMLLLAMFMVAAVGILLSVAAVVWRTESQREKEAELLWIGDQYARALASYQAASPNQIREYPRKLEQLLLDSRQSTAVRHLRRLYRDPFTGKSEWGLLKDGSGCITGIYSLGKGAPLKQGGFGTSRNKFAGAATYADWVFVAEAGNALPTSMSAAGAVGMQPPPFPSANGATRR